MLTGFAGEENEAFAVGFQACDVDSEGFDGAVGAAGVDADADCCSEFSGDARLLERILESYTETFEVKDVSYLELGK